MFLDLFPRYRHHPVQGRELVRADIFCEGDLDVKQALILYLDGRRKKQNDRGLSAFGTSRAMA